MVTNHEVDDGGEGECRKEPHGDDVTDHRGQEVGRHAVEPAHVLMSAGEKYEIQVDVINQSYFHILTILYMLLLFLRY